MSKDKVVSINQAKNDEQPVKKNQDIEIVFGQKYDDEAGLFKLDIVKFENIVGHQIGQNWVAVFTADGNTKLYPASRVEEITVTVKE